MFSSFDQFNNLHQGAGLFVLPNVWNAKIAIRYQEMNAQAIATSSAAVAGSLGYEDGEKMPFRDYLFVINRILASVQIPLSVDMEMGYGASDEQIYINLLNLIDLGVAGINIEDSTINQHRRVLKSARTFAKTIENIKNMLVSKNLNLFMNIRCDTYILDVDQKQRETNIRLKIYEAAGGDGIFLPCICAEEDIASAVDQTKLPLNVMYIPGLPDLEKLNQLGVKRMSMGPFVFNQAYDRVGDLKFN